MEEPLRTVTVSMVVYDSRRAEIEGLLRSLQQDDSVLRWVVVDNGNSEEIREAVAACGGTYLATGKNEGFGKGHNLALQSLGGCPAEYHLFLNPDISFGRGVLRELTAVLDERPEAGVVMPKILYPDGGVQHLCKRLPSPADLILRRFLPGGLKSMTSKRIDEYELKHLDYDAPAYVPSLSGCFLLVRRSVLQSVGGFDERFFLYMEDVDLCRRIGAVSRLLYWPGVSIIHGYQMGSYRNRKLMWLHVRSAILYFNKWGWMRDSARDALNARTTAAPRELPAGSADGVS